MLKYLVSLNYLPSASFQTVIKYRLYVIQFITYINYLVVRAYIERIWYLNNRILKKVHFKLN